MQDLLVMWDWESDGTWDTPLAPEKTTVHFYPEPGTYTITLLVEDTGGLTDTVTQEVMVLTDKDENNTPPAASFTVDPAEGYTATVFSVDASASTDQETATEHLEVRWDWESDGMWDTDFTTAKTATHTYELPEVHLITLEVVDEGGLSAIETQQVWVVPGNDNNTPPHAVVYATPSYGDTGTEFSFTAIDSTDLEDPPEALSVRWDFESDGIWDTDFDSDKNALFQYQIPGRYTCTAELMDTGGLTSQAAVKVMVFKPCACPFELLLEENQLNSLRRFRDDVLARSAAGRLLIASCSRYRKEIVNTLHEYPGARALARDLLKGMLVVFDPVLRK